MSKIRSFLCGIKLISEVLRDFLTTSQNSQKGRLKVFVKQKQQFHFIVKTVLIRKLF